ncbi:MAG: DUF3866 family protein, partial [Bifidobacteriaceae bacterium]|nr:DUF3866 family protein [Bifidobacteriaceae bacterium]
MSGSTRLVLARVVEVTARRPGVATLACSIEGAGGGETVPALAYTDVTGPVRAGDPVVLNTAALEAGLGTGGFAFVVAPAECAGIEGGGGGSGGGGGVGIGSGGAGSGDGAAAPSFLVKARYTPLQVLVSGVDEQTSPHHEALREAGSVGGMPVVTADLHSALPAIVAGATADGARPRIVYVMPDGGALPIAFSRTVAALREAGLLAATVTAGQAYGGDFEAVGVHSALLAARLVAGADLVIVAQGPGNLGTGTRWGFSGVAVGEWVNAAAALGGRAVGALRVSGADGRARHRGLSHHSATAYGAVALRPADLAVPAWGD